MTTVLIVIHLLIAVALICVILMQRTAQDGGGLMGGGGGGSTMGGLFTARGSANLLTRTTAILATLFIAMSLLLGILAAQQHQAKSLADEIVPIVDAEKAAEKKADAPKAPAKPAAPSVPSVPVAK